MVPFFKRKKKERQPPQLLDIDGKPIQENDEVMVLRYELGRCRMELEGLQYFYVSQHNGHKVSYTKMFDAITGHQKVKKITEENS